MNDGALKVLISSVFNRRCGNVKRGEGYCGLLVMLVGRTVSDGRAGSCDLSPLDLGQDTDELATNGIVGVDG
jgi:hypothetical protein